MSIPASHFNGLMTEAFWHNTITWCKSRLTVADQTHQGWVWAKIDVVFLGWDSNRCISRDHAALCLNTLQTNPDASVSGYSRVSRSSLLCYINFNFERITRLLLIINSFCSLLTVLVRQGTLLILLSSLTLSWWINLKCWFKISPNSGKLRFKIKVNSLSLDRIRLPIEKDGNELKSS